MKMVRNLFLTLILVSVSVFAAGIPEVKNTDNITMGRGANGDDKEFIFNIGDGATNPKLLINDILKVFNFNKGLDVTGAGVFSGNVSGADGTFTGNGDFSGANLKVGPGTNTEQFMSFKISGEEVGFKFDPVTGEVLQKKKAGDAYKKLGTGSGSASTGINGFGEDDNANAEDGTTSWSNTGGTFISFDNTAPNEKKVIEGERSFRFTPSAQNDEVVGPTLNFDFTKFHGRTCELGIEYTGADENLELHVVDANGDILNEDLPNNRKIPTRSISTGPFSVSFQCPRAADILGDANKGNLHVEIVNVGASVSPAIDWDLTFMGTDRNLGTSVISDICSLTFNMVTDTIVTQAGCPQGISIATNGTGQDSIVIPSGFYSVSPNVQCTPSNQDAIVGAECLVNSGATPGSLTNIPLRVNSSGGTGVNSTRVNVTLTKQGADAQQVVQTYKASPVVTETENTFTAFVSSVGAVSDENLDWINGDCSKLGTGGYSCPLNETLNTKLICNVTVNDVYGSGTIMAKINVAESSTSDVRYTTQLSGSNTLSDRGVTLTCNKVGADFVKPQTKNLSLAGITVNSYAEQSQKQVRVETCQINNNGTATIDTNSKLCESWIQSVVRTSIGQVAITIIPGTFSSEPTCSGANLDSDKIIGINPSSSTAVGTATRVSSTGALFDTGYNITCIGVK